MSQRYTGGILSAALTGLNYPVTTVEYLVVAGGGAGGSSKGGGGGAGGPGERRAHRDRHGICATHEREPRDL